MSSAVVERVLPLDPTALWAVLIDTPRMLRLDPLLESYEPERGEIAEGTLNHAVSRVGPVRLRMVTRTELLRPPTRAVFVSVKPARPVRIRVEDSLSESGSGTLYSISISAEPVGLIGRVLAPAMARQMARSRRRLLDRLEAELGSATAG